MPIPPEKQSPVTTQTRSLAEVEPLCPICGKPIPTANRHGAVYCAARWPQWSHDNRIEADFRPYELRFSR